MRELQECLNIAKKIKDIENKIYELQAAISSPKNQVITGMPRGGNNDNAIEKYLVKVERLEYQKNEFCVERNHKWNWVKTRLHQNNLFKESTYKLLTLRFYYGHPWKKCVAVLKEKYPAENWNISKAFNTYGKINKIV